MLQIYESFQSGASRNCPKCCGIEPLLNNLFRIAHNIVLGNIKCTTDGVGVLLQNEEKPLPPNNIAAVHCSLGHIALSGGNHCRKHLCKRVASGVTLGLVFLQEKERYLWLCLACCHDVIHNAAYITSPLKVALMVHSKKPLYRFSSKGTSAKRNAINFIDFCTGNHPTSAGGGRCSEIGAVLRSLRSKDAAFRFLPVVVQ